jgi:non-specific protein-tyrosine kinase
MELRQYVSVILKWWWLILLSVALAAGGAWLATKDQPDLYQTSTTLMIGQAIEDINPTGADFFASERLAKTYSELIKRELVLRATARSLGFEDQWRALRQKISTTQMAGTQLMEISVTDTDPQRAKLIADELAQQLIDVVGQSEALGLHRDFILEQTSSLPTKIEAAQKEIQDLEAQMTEAFSARQILEIQNRIATLEGQIIQWQSTFAQYQLLLGEGSITALTVIEEAPLPTGPVGPQWLTVVFLAGAIGLILSIGAAFLLEYLDDTLKSPEDVEKVTGLNTVGAISRIRGNNPSDRLITARYPRSPISEAYRVMRTNLQFSALDHPLRTLVVTSPNPVEGKSTTLSNLGVVMAQAGRSVVLVDSDLRRPMLHRIFQLQNRTGLTSVLLQDDQVLDGHIQETGIENLRVLTSGPLPPNPSELLASQKMRNLVDRLKEEADVIIFDTPPALPVTDAAVLSTQVDGVLLVTDAGRTRRGAARRATDNLRQVGDNILGAALNRLTSRSTDGYYYYYYYAEDNKGRRRRRKRWYQRIRLFGRSK